MRSKFLSFSAWIWLYVEDSGRFYLNSCLKIHWMEWWESSVDWCRSGFTPKFFFGVYSELIFQTESSYFLCPQFLLIINHVNDLCAKWWSSGLCWSMFLFRWKFFSSGGWWFGMKWRCFTASSGNLEFASWLWILWKVFRWVWHVFECVPDEWCHFFDILNSWLFARVETVLC